jgi:hypothetical protein
MTTKTFLGAMAVVTAVALTGTALVASNMGFKLNYQLKQQDGGVTSKSGTSTIALPDNRQTGMNDSKTLMDDIGSVNVAEIQKFIAATDTLQVYTGRKSSPHPNFPLAAGEGYRVKMTTTVNYIIVGSDDPAIAYQLKQQDGGVTSKSGTQQFAYNYHQTAVDSKQLMDDIGSASVAEIQKFIIATDTLQVYTGRKSSPHPNFAMVPGESYRIKMTTTVNYIPSHY